MTGLGTSILQQLSGLPEFVGALSHAADRDLVDLDQWALFTRDDQVNTRSEAVNRRFPGRSVLCFAERRDNDDVACVILTSSADYSTGQVLIVHDFAKSGSEVDAVFSDFWEWFRAAVEDMIDTFRHWNDVRYLFDRDGVS